HGAKAIHRDSSHNTKVEYGTQTMSGDTSGVTPDFGVMRNQIPARGGRFIDAIDVAESRRTVFLGDKLAENIFGKTPAVGKTIMVNLSPFLVVGVLEPKSQDSSYSCRDT